MEPKVWPEVAISNQDHTSAAVVIIGSGFSGICQAIELIKNNIHNFVILEKGSNVGGTWLDNKYPGCQCDIWSILYSYSFEQNPLWSREYPGQQELLHYLIGIASKYGLYNYIRFNSTGESATWDDTNRTWKTKVRVAGEKDKEYGEFYTMTSDFLVSAVGQLNVPKYPDIEGLDSFEGKIQHSARWDWRYDIRGKRIAMIGNGATAVQIAPELAKNASHLTVHQRTPNWVITRADAPTPNWRKKLFQCAPILQHRIRGYMMDGREELQEFITDVDSPWNKTLRDDCFAKLQATFPNDEAMRKTLTPNYHFGAKRLLVSDDYYPTLARENCRLETRSIVRVTPKGITVRDPETGAESTEEIDLLVCATGFKTTQFMHPINVTGRHGRALADIWDEGATAYNGITVRDLPNFGMMYGPNTNLGHSSIILMIEAQSRYITALVNAVLQSRRTLREGSNITQKADGAPGELLTLTVRDAVVEAWDEEIQGRLAKTVFADDRVSSWYKDGKTGRIINNWPGNCVEYAKRLEHVVWADYEGGEQVSRMRKGQEEAFVPRFKEEIVVSDKVLVGVSVLGMAAGGALGWALRNQRSVASLIRGR